MKSSTPRLGVAFEWVLCDSKGKPTEGAIEFLLEVVGLVPVTVYVAATNTSREGTQPLGCVVNWLTRNGVPPRLLNWYSADQLATDRHFQDKEPLERLCSHANRINVEDYVPFDVFAVIDGTALNSDGAKAFDGSFPALEKIRGMMGG